MRKSGPPKGLISYLVLELLAERPRYGYELLGRDHRDQRWPLGALYGSVYPILYKFEENGVAERVEREAEPDRKYFALTDHGREKLVEKRREIGDEAQDFGDVVLGFYHMYAALATDDRFAVDDADGDWKYDERHSAWIVEQMIRHHERDFGEFERVTDSVEEFHATAETEDDATESETSSGSAD